MKWKPGYILIIILLLLQKVAKQFLKLFLAHWSMMHSDACLTVWNSGRVKWLGWKHLLPIGPKPEWNCPTQLKYNVQKVQKCTDHRGHCDMLLCRAVVEGQGHTRCPEISIITFHDVSFFWRSIFITLKVAIFLLI